MKNEKSLLLFILIHVFIFPNAISIISSILVCSITCSKNRARSYLIFAFILSYALTFLRSYAPLVDEAIEWNVIPFNVRRRLTLSHRSRVCIYCTGMI